MRILHVASHTTNVGDGALNGVIAAALARAVDEPVEIVEEDVVLRPRSLTAEDVDAFDLVVVGGGGAISTGRSNAECGMAMPMTVAELRASRTPFAFVGLGHNLFHGEELRYREELARTIAWATERGHPFSVRNDGSLARLRLVLGDVTGNVVEIPDPGFFVAAPPVEPVEVAGDRYVLVQLAADRFADRVAGRRSSVGPVRRLQEHRARVAFAEQVAAWARSVSDHTGGDIVFAPHIPSDLGIVADVIQRCGRDHRRRPFRVLGTPHPRHAERYFGAYAAADVVVGMRGHAVICGVGLDRPVVAVSTHPKVAGFMEACGLGAWCTTPGPHLGRDLARLTGPLLEGETSSYHAARRAAVADFRPRFDAFIDAVVAHARVTR